jgi:hypothetical protein
MRLQRIYTQQLASTQPPIAGKRSIHSTRYLVVMVASPYRWAARNDVRLQSPSVPRD